MNQFRIVVVELVYKLVT